MEQLGLTAAPECMPSLPPTPAAPDRASFLQRSPIIAYGLAGVAVVGLICVASACEQKLKLPKKPAVSDTAIPTPTLHRLQNEIIAVLYSTPQPQSATAAAPADCW